MAFYIKELRGIDAVQDEYTFRGYVRSTWCDPRLAFDRAEAGSDTRVKFGAAAERAMQRSGFRPPSRSTRSKASRCWTASCA
jgi:hypothetical protein